LNNYYRLRSVRRIIRKFGVITRYYLIYEHEIYPGFRGEFFLSKACNLKPIAYNLSLIPTIPKERKP